MHVKIKRQKEKESIHKLRLKVIYSCLGVLLELASMPIF